MTTLSAAEYRAAVGKSRRHKYGAKRYTSHDGISHPSVKQGKRWEELLLMQKAGAIERLRREVRYALMVNGTTVGHYVADHVYIDGCEPIVEDVKSDATATALFRWKAKHFKAQYGIEIRIV